MDRIYSSLRSFHLMTICLCSMLLLNSCTPTAILTDPAPKVEETAVFAPPVYTGSNFKGYVDEVNWYMIYMFSYTQVLNDYAMQRGWKPPAVAPLCRYIEIPPMKPVPVFEPKGGYKGASFEHDLVIYTKSLNRQYREQIDNVNASKTFQKKYMCIY